MNNLKDEEILSSSLYNDGKPMVEVERDIETVFEEYYSKGWTDGLPIIPPTEKRVERMLAFTDRTADEVVATLPPAYREASVKKIATNAVMAGCLPQYFPIVLAAVEAIGEPKFHARSVLTTTGPKWPSIIVNGPIRHELAIHSGVGCFGPGSRANASMGRAITLCMINLAGAVPGAGTMSSQGSPSRYTCCIAENEEESPWEPLHSERGLPAETSAVTVIASESPHDLHDNDSKTAADLLYGFAQTMAGIGKPGAYTVGLRQEWVLALNPQHAANIYHDPTSTTHWTKKDVKRFLYENARIPVEVLPKRGNWNWRVWPKWIAEVPGCMVPIVNEPDDFVVIVVGGWGPHSSYIPTMVSRSVTKAITFRDGTPVRSVYDLGKAYAR